MTGGATRHLEVRPTTNPYYMTSTAISQLAFAPRKFDAPSVARLEPPSDPYMPEIDFRFLYTRESDKIGKGIDYSDNFLSQTFRRTVPTEVARRKGVERENHNLYKTDSELGFQWRDIGKSHRAVKDDSASTPQGEALEGLLRKYKHETKRENPLYTTANNEIGMKRPTAATFTVDRKARAQAFSRSFPTQMSRGTGLNTSVTRSVVHPALDPQFI